MKRTGLTDSQMRSLRQRDKNFCVFTGTENERLVPQHRRNRGMGGDRTANVLANAVLVDSLINGLIEANATLAEIAKAYGIKVPIWVSDVAAVPVFYQHEHAWFVLTGDDRREVSAVEALDMMHTVYDDEFFVWKARADQSPQAAILALRGAR